MNGIELANTTKTIFDGNREVFLRTQQQRENRKIQEIAQKRDNFSYELANFFIHNGGVTEREISWIFGKQLQNLLNESINYSYYRANLFAVMKCEKRLSLGVKKKLYNLFDRYKSYFE